SPARLAPAAGCSPSGGSGATGRRPGALGEAAEDKSGAGSCAEPAGKPGKDCPALRPPRTATSSAARAHWHLPATGHAQGGTPLSRGPAMRTSGSGMIIGRFSVVLATAIYAIWTGESRGILFKLAVELKRGVAAGQPAHSRGGVNVPV